MYNSMIGGIVQGAAGSAMVGYGVYQHEESKKLRKKYDAYEKSIPLYDADQQSHLSTIRRQRRAYMSGTDPVSAYNAQRIGGSLAQTQQNMLRAGTSSPGQLLRAQVQANQAYQSNSARSYDYGTRLLGMEGTLVNAMANRAYMRQLSTANRMWSEYARMKEDSNANIQAGIGTIAASGETFGGGGGGSSPGGGGGSVKSSQNPRYGQQVQGLPPQTGGPADDNLPMVW